MALSLIKHHSNPIITVCTVALHASSSHSARHREKKRDCDLDGDYDRDYGVTELR